SIRSLTMFAGTVAGLNSKLMHFRANKVGLQEFLDADSANYIERSSAAGDLAVDLNECVFSWGTDTYSLAPATLQVKAGNFITVVGCIGSGKSSFLSAICGEMPLTSGQGCIYGRVGYVEQKPWIMNATFCDNVPMGADFDKVYFLQVIDACALAADVGLFPKGDLTMIGTNGVNLSGGQKVRLALASIISHKTQILVTHAEHLVPLSDTVITFVDGKMSVVRQVPLTLSTVSIDTLGSKDTISSSDSVDQQASAADIYSKPLEYRKLASLWSAIWHFIQLSGYGTVAIILGIQIAQNYALYCTQSLRISLMTDSNPATMVQSLKYYLLINAFVSFTHRQIRNLERWIRRKVLTTRLEFKMCREIRQLVLTMPLPLLESLPYSTMSDLYLQCVNSISQSFPMTLCVFMVSNKLSAVATITRVIKTSPGLLVMCGPLVALNYAIECWHRGTLPKLYDVHREAISRHQERLDDVLKCNRPLLRIHDMTDTYLDKLCQLKAMELSYESSSDAV
ncbi:hypothetical protein IW146_002528, partial [Coemansia sp. RSA 922]